MKFYYVEIKIPEQEVEVEVLALNAEEATRIAMEDVTPLKVVHLDTYTNGEVYL